MDGFYVVCCRNKKTGAEFEQKFNSLFLATKFYYKAKYSKEIIITGTRNFIPR